LYGWNGRILRVDLSKRKIRGEEFGSDFALGFLGGRGFAIKILWDELKPGIEPLSPENKLVFAAGPLTGFPLPSSGKLLIASKSPLTGGYGDGNLGSWASLKLRRAGYDAVVLEGKAQRPSFLLVENEKAEIMDAHDLWGLGTFETEERLTKKYGKTAGVLVIGPAGENLVRYATVVSQKGRSGGRPGMGAVMGSKNLKALVFLGSKEIPVADAKGLEALGKDGYKSLLGRRNYEFWKRQGTMATIEWSQENCVLPTHNFREGAFDEAGNIGGYAMEKLKTTIRGCPECNMICGNVIEDTEEKSSELDYENVAMLGSNTGLGNLKKVAVLNRLADDYGVDTISLGNVIGFAMEASEKKLINYVLDWGDFDGAKTLTEDIVYRRGIGSFLADGVRRAAERLGGDAERWAMHVKGLEISAYDCHSTPGMALSFGTSPIGAHHKDAWVIAWEVSVGREAYSEAKVDKVLEFQRIRGGMFESLVTCRFPWIELGFELDWYPRFLKAATGVEMTFGDLYTIADRIYTLIRAFWVREYKTGWSSAQDYPPARWFDEPLTKGPYKGATLDRNRYEVMLQWYYQRRGWGRRGIPTEATLKRLGLEDVAQQLKQHLKLAP